MEDILASIKRVIKEGETQATPRRMSPRPAATTLPPHSDVAAERDEVLELRQPLEPHSHVPPEPVPIPTPPATPAATPDRVVPPVAGLRSEPPASSPTPGVSSATAEATRDALGALSRLVVRPEPGSDGTLEGLVRDLLKPMLADWLDANLPGLVEDMVAREIARITNRG